MTSICPFATLFTNSVFVKTTGVVMFAYSTFTVFGVESKTNGLGTDTSVTVYVPNGNTDDVAFPFVPVVIVSSTFPCESAISNFAPFTNEPSSAFLVTSICPFATLFTNSNCPKTTGVVMSAYSSVTV